MTLRALPALLAIAVLAGCGSAATGSGSNVAASAPAATTPPASCHQLYETWKHGPASAVARRLKSALNAVQSASSADDLPRLTATLRRAGAIAHRLAAMPPPSCADPKGYYGRFLGLIRAASDNARAGSGLGTIALILAPLQRVQGVEKQLGAELDGTVGKNR